MVYGYATTLHSISSMTAVALTDGSYYAGESQLYAAATVKSPEGREVVAKSPAGSFRIHAIAVATVQIEAEDGTYQSNFRFGEICGAGKAPLLQTDRPD